MIKNKESESDWLVYIDIDDDSDDDEWFSTGIMLLTCT
jgi:hypothetical protein